MKKGSLLNEGPVLGQAFLHLFIIPEFDSHQHPESLAVISFLKVRDLVTRDVPDEVEGEIYQPEVEVQISIGRATPPPGPLPSYGYPVEPHAKLPAVVSKCGFKFIEEPSLQNPLEPIKVVRAAWVELDNFFVEINHQGPVFTELEALPQDERTSGIS